MLGTSASSWIFLASGVELTSVLLARELREQIVKGALEPEAVLIKASLVRLFQAFCSHLMQSRFEVKNFVVMRRCQTFLYCMLLPTKHCWLSTLGL